MIFFRADMNETIATGHIMRCLSIADAAREAGEESCFIVADENACKLLEDRGYRYIVLHSVWNNPDNETEAMINLISKENVGVLLVDSYKVTHNYLDTLNKHTKVVYLDDLYEEAYPVSAVINYDACEDRETYLKRYAKTNTSVYYGYEYAPLRKEFSNLKHAPFNKIGEQSLLLLSGGTDPEHFIKKILKEIDIEKFRKIYAVCGRYSEDYVELVKTYMGSKTVEILQNVSNLWEYMVKADICISAAGNTAYELMAAGTPTILYTMSKEQVPAAKALAEKTSLHYAGSLEDKDTYRRILSMVAELSDDKKKLESISKSISKQLDGKGSSRIAEIATKSIKVGNGPAVKNDVYSADSFSHVKGYLALLILVHHLYQFTGFLSGSAFGYALNLLGHFAVVIFTFMSGFGVWTSYVKKGDEYVRDFPRKRVLPFYLSYVLFVVIYVVYAIIMKNNMSIGVLIRSFTYGGTIVSFGWFFQTILLLYLLFYLFRRFAKNDAWFWIFMALSITIIVTISFWLALPKNTYVINVSFLIGMIIAEIKNRFCFFYKKRTGIAFTLSLVFFIVLAFCATLMDFRLSEVMKSSIVLDFVYLIVMMLQDVALAVFVFYLIYCLSLISPRILINPVSSFLGKFSLEIYALQGLVLGSLRAVIDSSALFALVSVVVIILISIPFHLLIDVLKKIAKGKLDNE